MARRLKGAERRRLILKMAKRLFARKGYGGVSMDELAAACGVSPAVIYRHFPSKEALYREVLHTFACAREDYLTALLEGPDDFAETLRRLTLAYLRARLRDRDTLRMELRSIADEDRVRRAIYESQWAGLAGYVEDMLRERAGGDGRRAAEVARLAALAYVGMVREALIRLGLKAAPAETGEEGLEGLSRDLVTIFLAGIGGAIRRSSGPRVEDQA